MSVIPIETFALLEYANTGLSLLIIAEFNSALSNNTIDGVLVTKFAFLSVNFKSSNWLGVQVDWFCDLNNEPRYGWVLLIEF